MNEVTKSSQLYSALIIAVEPFSSCIYRVEIKLWTPIEILPGQYVMLQNSAGEWRAYSVFEQLDNNTFVLLIKALKLEHTIPYLITLLRRKITIPLKGPYGNCVPNQSMQHTVCIAQGIGVTPAYKILCSVNDYDDNKKFSLIWFIDPFELKSLADLVTKKFSDQNHIHCYFINSNIEQDLINTYEKIFTIIDYPSQTECFIFGSIDFVKKNHALFNNHMIASIKSDHQPLEKINIDQEIIA